MNIGTPRRILEIEEQPAAPSQPAPSKPAEQPVKEPVGTPA